MVGLEQVVGRMLVLAAVAANVGRGGGGWFLW